MARRVEALAEQARLILLDAERDVAQPADVEPVRTAVDRLLVTIRGVVPAGGVEP